MHHTRFTTSAHEWDEEMDTPAIDLMLDLRDEDEFDTPTFELAFQELQEMERERYVEEIPWREAFCDFGPPWKCGTWDNLIQDCVHKVLEEIDHAR